MSTKKPRPAPSDDPTVVSLAGQLSRAHARFGWVALLVGLAFGTTIEGLLGFKTPSFLLDPLRHELWSLAHFHCAMLAIVNLVYVPWAENPALSASRRLAASRALRVGSLLMPLGFFLGGIAHPEGDPGVGIFLAPAGALLLLYAVGLQALAAWRRP